MTQCKAEWLSFSSPTAAWVMNQTQGDSPVLAEMARASHCTRGQAMRDTHKPPGSEAPRSRATGRALEVYPPGSPACSALGLPCWGAPCPACVWLVKTPQRGTHSPPSTHQAPSHSAPVRSHSLLLSNTDLKPCLFPNNKMFCTKKLSQGTREGPEPQVFVNFLEAGKAVSAATPTHKPGRGSRGR